MWWISTLSLSVMGDKATHYTYLKDSQSLEDAAGEDYESCRLVRL